MGRTSHTSDANYIVHLEHANARLQMQNDGLIDEVSALRKRIAKMETDRFKNFNGEECWIYMEGDDNYLESLVCPVVISAKKLIELGA